MESSEILLIQSAVIKAPQEVTDVENAPTEQGPVVNADKESPFCDKWTCFKWTWISIVLIIGVYGLLAYIIANETTDKGNHIFYNHGYK